MILIEKSGEGVHKPHLTLSTDQREFQEIGRRGPTHEEASTGNPFCKDAYTTHGQSDY